MTANRNFIQLSTNKCVREIIEKNTDEHFFLNLYNERII